MIQTLEHCAGLERATAVFDAAPKIVPPFEASLKAQKALLAFHFADENSYRTREKELGRAMVAEGSSEEQKSSVAKAILGEVDRYRRVYLARLETISADVEELWKRCEQLVSADLGSAAKEFPELSRGETLRERKFRMGGWESKP